MTQEEFTDAYAANNKMTREEIDGHFVAVPCDCGDDECHGWQMADREHYIEGKRLKP